LLVLPGQPERLHESSYFNLLVVFAVIPYSKSLDE